MRRVLVLIFLGLLLSGGTAFSAKYGDACIDRSLLDTKFDGMVVHLNKWFADHAPATGTLVRRELAFESPRWEITAVTNKRQDTGLYYLSATDDAVYAVRGKAEQHINGEWEKVQAGYIYVVARGVVPGIKVAKGQRFLVLSFTTPPQPGKSDKVALKGVAPGTVVGDETLIDTKHNVSMLFDLASFFTAHPVEPGKQLWLDVV